MTDTEITVLLKKVKETKGAYRYEEIDDNGNKRPFGDTAVGTIYIRKSALTTGEPNVIELTIKPVTD